MNVYLTADHHFGHENIIGYCHRPYGNVELMDYSMTLRWNQRVKPGDLVIHVGDFIWKHEKTYVNRILTGLNGTVILIKGSHDKATSGFIPTVPYMLMRIGEFKCLLNHQPCYPKGHPNFELTDRRISKETLEKIDFIISAHVHGKWLWNWKNFNIGVDKHDFYPLPLEGVQKELEAATTYMLLDT